MPETELEQALRSFDRVATLVRKRQERSVWRFEFHDQTYFLYFYPRVAGWAALTRKSSALTEFFRLQSMQKVNIPSPRAVAHLSGFRIRGVLGDALIVEAVESAIELDAYLRDKRPTAVERRDLLRQVVTIVNGIGRLKLGHSDIRLSSFLFSQGRLHFHDTSRLHGHGMRLNDLLRFGHDAARLVHRGELIRGWNGIEPDNPVPDRNTLSPKIWKQLLRDCRRETDDFGRLRIGDWSGHFVKTSRFARPWSIASRTEISADDWRAAWPVLLAQIESGQLTVIKRDPSGEVLEGEVVLAGKPIPVIVKRPRQKIWWRLILDFFRPSRGLRMWMKTWMVVARDLPTEWPMLIMQRGLFGGVSDSILVFERVPGPRLDKIDLNALPPPARQSLFYRAGRIMRRLEHSGLMNYDTKSTNWIVYDDGHNGPSPIMIDCYGVRSLTYFLEGWGMQRLLRAMRNHKQYTPDDSLWLCRGFTPRAGSFEQEQPGQAS